MQPVDAPIDDSVPRDSAMFGDAALGDAALVRATLGSAASNSAASNSAAFNSAASNSATLDSEGFRLRGQQVTRLETFVDAAFAFAVTLLVVSFDAMPDSFTELYDALRRLPAFLGGFAVLALFWIAHHRFSRRFGLEDGMVIFLSMAFVAAVLFYVYPLRMVMSAGMHFFTDGWAPSEFVVRNFLEFRLIFIIYGIGFAVLAGIIVWLNWHALRQADALQLDTAERAITKSEIVSQLILIGTALLSIAIALSLPPQQGWMQALPGMAYALLAVLMPWHAVRAQRRTAALLAQRGVASNGTAA